MGLKGKKIRQYRKDGGKTVHVYELSGDAQSIAKAENIQASNARFSDGGGLLYFSPRFVGYNVDFIFTGEELNQLQPDTTRLDELESLAEQFPSMAATFASQAQELLMRGASSANSGSTTQETEKETESEEGGIENA